MYKRRCLNCMEALLSLISDGLHRMVLRCPHGVLKSCNCLIIRMLNNISIVVGFMEYGYLCEAKVPYYGQSTYRHRANGYESPLRDASGKRGIISKG